MRENTAEGIYRTRLGNLDERKGVHGERAFARMAAKFNQARQRHRAIHSYYSFAGLHARFRIVGRELSHCITLPFAHLETGIGNKDFVKLRVDLWDENAVGIPYPNDLVDLVEPVSGLLFERRMIIGGDEERFIVSRCRTMITWFDRSRRHIIGWVPANERLSSYETGHPLRFPLLLWHADRNLQMLHAALVAKGGYGVLFAGKAGSGKTTAALSCLCAGFEYLGDDYIALQVVDDGSFIGHSLYSSAWLSDSHLSRFASLIPNCGRGMRPDQNRNPIFLYSQFAERLPCSALIRVVVLPRVSAGLFTRFRVASKREALLALAPTSILNLPSTGANALARMARLVDQLPCFWLELGTDLQSVPDSLDSLLSELSLT